MPKGCFFGVNPVKPRQEVIDNLNVNISNISTNSVLDASQNVWKSRVDLEITNKSGNSFKEFAVSFDLPQGCWISDYYLYVEGKKEEGILAEKKSAKWVYSNIRNVNRDPGILFYLTGNRVSFRVFPFSGNETRKTGIEFLHKEPVKLKIDGNIIELGDAIDFVNETVETENFAYVYTEQKQRLPSVQRKPYFHFMVDVSENKDAHLFDFSKLIENVLDENKPLSQNAQISFVNSYVNTFPLDENWQSRYKSQVFEGGFFLERAIRLALYNAYKNGEYPVIVTVTDDIQSAVLDSDFSDFKIAFPESVLFFNMDSDGALKPHSLIEKPKEQLEDAHYSFDKTVLEYRISDNSRVYLADNNEPEIILKKDIFNINEADIKEKNWLSAVNMQAKFMSQTLHPETSAKDWRNMVKYSFISKVMTPVTSYLVVENEAQKAALKKKQEQVLSGGKLLDTDDDSQSMSEPGLLLLAILLGAVLWGRRFRKQARPE